MYLADHGKARAAPQTPLSFTVSALLAPLALQHRQAQTILEGASSHKIKYVVQGTMYLSLHSFSPKLCSATIDLNRV